MSEPSSPFALTLHVTAGAPARVRAVLHNRASSAQTYLHDATSQPSELLLTDGADRSPEPTDVRETRKYDTSVPREAYRRLAPGDSVVLVDAPVLHDAHGYMIRWGPFVYTALPAGRYTARVRWDSRERDWKETDGARHGTLRDVWLGTVESDRVELTLP